MCVCFACLSVTGLRLKYTGLCIVYVPFGACCSGCHRAMAWKLRLRTRKIEDNARMSQDVWKTVNPLSPNVADLQHFDTVLFCGFSLCNAFRPSTKLLTESLLVVRLSQGLVKKAG